MNFRITLVLILCFSIQPFLLKNNGGFYNDLAGSGFSNPDQNENAGQDSIISEEVKFIAGDGITLKGTIYYKDNNKAEMPGILLMHHLMRSSSQWANSNLLQELVLQGYVCLTFDFRGHGQSEYWNLNINFNGDFDQVINSIKDFVELYAFKDMLSALDFLKNYKQTDKNNIALIGGSLGANCAINGNTQPGVKAVVSLSPSTVGLFSGLKKENIFFIVGESDHSMGGPDYATETKTIFDDSFQPKKLLVLPGTSSHGLECLDKKNVNREILDWIQIRFSE